MTPRLTIWLKALAQWIDKARALWVGLGVASLAIALTALLPGSLDDHLRYSGWLLEMFGIFIVVFGLNEKLRLFKRPTLLRHFLEWLAECPSYHPQSKTVALQASASMVVGIGEVASVVIKPVENTPDARLDALEKVVTHLRERQDNLTRQMNEQEQQWNAALTTEREAREQTMRELRTTIEAFSVGGFHIEAMGVFWLLLGATLATMSPEISAGLNGIAGWFR